MKSIIKTFLAIAGGITLLASCTPKDPVYAKILSTDIKELTVEALNPDVVNVKLTADGEWYAYAPSWIKLEPETGNGDATVKVTIDVNVDGKGYMNAPRKDVIAFMGAKEKAIINILQKGESALASERKYAKITKAEELDLTKGYLIVFDLGSGSLVGAAPLATEIDNERSYAYMPVGKLSEVEGVITVPNGKQAFYFEKTETEGIHYMKQFDGTYPWQAASYDNFYRYSAANVAKSGKWKITFKENGLVQLDNTQRGTGGYFLMYDGSYNSIGTYTGSKQDNKVLPYLYKDTAEPSKEILSVPEETIVIPSATSAQITVKANCKWSVRNYSDGWIKIDDSSLNGEGDGVVKITFDANKTGAERIGELQFIGEETNTWAKIRQFVPIKNVADLNKWVESKNTVYELEAKDLKVSYVSGSNIYLEDATAGILLYAKNITLVGGNVINGTVHGSCTLYNALPELTSMNMDSATTASGTAPETEITFDELKKNYSKYISRRILLKGVDVTDGVSGSGDRDGKIKNGEIEFTVRSNDSKAVFSTGSKGDIVVFPAVRNKDRQLSVYKDSFKPTLVVTSVTAKDLTVEKGKTVKADITTQTSAAPSFKSKNDAIATVTPEGVVSGVSVGETTITVTYAAEGIYTAAEATFKVTVTEPAVESPLGKFTSNLEGGVTGVSSAYTDGKVVISEVQYFSLKLGTSSKYGTATVKVPAGTKKVAFYAAAWKGQTNCTLKITTGGTTVFEKNIKPHDGAIGGPLYAFGAFTSQDAQYYYEIDLGTGLPSETTAEVTTTGSQRCVIFGLNAE